MAYNEYMCGARENTMDTVYDVGRLNTQAALLHKLQSSCKLLAEIVNACKDAGADKNPCDTGVGILQDAIDELSAGRRQAEAALSLLEYEESRLKQRFAGIL
eukprot:GHVU01190215.1.p5 GENE.GHVU01190215.1~~GHVU01190215.1.p5  ORF type:complete len:102 (+),score=14.17 GHVU01190215.1:109-414(+)